MAITLSDHLKALLYPANLLMEEGCRIPREKCFTVLKFDYECNRSQDRAGFPYGETNTTILNFTIRLMRPEEGKQFFQQMQQNEPGYYTFLFNARHTEQTVTDYEDAMMVRGFVIDVEDDYTTTPSMKGSTEQMLIHVKLLLAHITYVGTNGNRTIAITRSE